MLVWTVLVNNVCTRCFYLLIALNVISGLLYTLFYHPPTFHMKHRIRTKTQQMKIFDYVGAALFVAGLILFEIGFLWGGGVGFTSCIVPSLLTDVLPGVPLEFGPSLMHAPHRSGNPRSVRVVGSICTDRGTSSSYENVQERALGCSMCSSRPRG